MSQNVFHPASYLVPQFARSLAQVLVWIDKTEAYAASRKFKADVLLTDRLQPDMFPLVRQIGSACDAAKLCVVRLTGVSAPSHADNETTFAEVRARVESVVAWLEAHSEISFEGADEARVRFPWYPGHSIAGAPYLKQFALPNFYFHLSMAYAILRKNGVPLGKADFLGDLPFEADQG